MLKFFRTCAPVQPRRGKRAKPEPGPLALLAYDYAALDAVAWAKARRRARPAEFEAR